MPHEDFGREQHVEKSSDKSFGLVFAGVFLLIALWPLVHRSAPRWWALVPAVLFAFVAFVKPAWFARPNQLWTALGIGLAKIVGPVALVILFYGVLTPMGWLMRSAGKDPLRLKRDSEAESYWIERTPPGPPADSLMNQY